MKLITLFYNRNSLVANQHTVFTLGKDKGCSVFDRQWNWLPPASDFLFVAILWQLVHSYTFCRAAPVCLVLAINGWDRILHWHESQFKNCKGPDLAQCEMNKDLTFSFESCKAEFCLVWSFFSDTSLFVELKLRFCLITQGFKAFI